MKSPEQDICKLAMAALKTEQLPLGLIDRVEQTVNRVLSSDIWARAQSSSQCLTEVPIALLKTVPGVAIPTVQRGVIDLIFRENAGWILVDYKSERVDSDAIPALVTYYEPQISAYVEAWETVVGEPVIEAGLFFTHTHGFVEFATRM